MSSYLKGQNSLFDYENNKYNQKMDLGAMSSGILAGIFSYFTYKEGLLTNNMVMVIMKAAEVVQTSQWKQKSP